MPSMPGTTPPSASTKLAPAGTATLNSASLSGLMPAL
jgi:hypothetical protein